MTEEEEESEETFHFELDPVENESSDNESQNSVVEKCVHSELEINGEHEEYSSVGLIGSWDS